MASINQKLLDELVAHSIFTDRYGKTVAKKIIKMLIELDPVIEAHLLKVMGRLDESKFTVKRLQSELKTLRDLLEETYKSMFAALDAEMGDLSAVLGEKQLALFNSIIPKEALEKVPLIPIPPNQIYAAATAKPFQGRLLKEWADTLAEGNLTKIVNAIQAGFLTGQTTQQIVQKVMGTKANNYKDGILEINRRNATMIVRTAVSHYASTARDKMFSENKNYIKGQVWCSTLDTRTSPTCFVPETEFYVFDDAKSFSTRLYTGQMNIIRTARGNQLKGTPNHPILTSKGWLGLHEIRPGDKVFHVDLGHGVGISGNECVQMPPKFADIMDSSGKPAIGEVFSISSSAEQFHGDGMGWDHEVNISTLDGELRDGVKTTRNQLVIENLLGFIHASTELPRFIHFLESVLRGRPTIKTSEVNLFNLECLIEPAFGSDSACFPSDNFEYFSWTNTLIEKFYSVSSIYEDESIMLASFEFRHDICLHEKSSDSGGRYTILLTKTTGGTAVPVLFDDVVSVGCERGTYHVCNLHTDSNIYGSGSIIVHNCIARDGKEYTLKGEPIDHELPYLGGAGRAHIGCRSTMIPILKSWREMGFDFDEMKPSTRSSMDGQVPEDTKYSDWLQRQSFERQTQVLGVERAKLLQSGVKVDQMFSDNGEFLTLEQLKQIL